MNSNRVIPDINQRARAVWSCTRGTRRAEIPAGRVLAAIRRYTRLRQLALPVTLDVPILDLSVEDHATKAAEALWTTNEIVAIVTEILAVELLLPCALLNGSSDPGELGTRRGVLVDKLSAALESLPPESLRNESHVRVLGILRSFEIEGE